MVRPAFWSKKIKSGTRQIQGVKSKYRIAEKEQQKVPWWLVTTMVEAVKIIQIYNQWLSLVRSPYQLPSQRKSGGFRRLHCLRLDSAYTVHISWDGLQPNYVLYMNCNTCVYIHTCQGCAGRSIFQRSGARIKIRRGRAKKRVNLLI